MQEPARGAVVKAQVDDPDLVARRREQIVAAAIKRFGESGYYTTTIKDIAQEAGISPGLIYQYFQDKEDVLLLALLECVDTYARELPPAAAAETTPLDRLRAAFAAYCRVVDANKAASVLAYRSTKSLDERRRKLVMERELATNALLAAHVRECVAAGHVRDVNVELVTYQLVMMAHAWALKAWHFGRLFTLEDYIAQCLDLALNGLLTGPGRRALSRPAEGG